MLFQYVRACLSFVAHFDINAPAGRERRAKETGRDGAQRPSRTPQPPQGSDGNRELLNFPGP